jgi:hypothetical protein
MSSQEESLLKSRLVEQCRAKKWYARRIEDAFAVGILDIIIVPTGFPTLFVEGKITDGLKFGPTDRQYIEGVKILQALGNGMPLLIGWRSQVMYVSNRWNRDGDYITRAFKQPDGAGYADTIEAWLHLAAGTHRGEQASSD